MTYTCITSRVMTYDFQQCKVLGSRAWLTSCLELPLPWGRGTVYIYNSVVCMQHARVFQWHAACQSIALCQVRGTYAALVCGQGKCLQTAWGAMEGIDLRF